MPFIGSVNLEILRTFLKPTVFSENRNTFTYYYFKY